MNAFRTALRPTMLRAAPKARATPILRNIGPMRTYATREKTLRDRSLTGPFSWQAAVLFLLTGGGLYYYFQQEKAAIAERKLQDAAAKSIGRPSIGGPFSLVDANGQPFTDQDMLGKWTLIYFGFTNCPDICPEELDKMGDAVDLLEAKVGQGKVLPIFVSVDPARDSIAQVKRYMSEFHPSMVGLTGDYESVKKACRSYRVYFSTPPDAKPTDDYLVDHSIFFYLMDPLGQFVDAFGKATLAEEVTRKTLDAMTKWEKAGGHAAAGLPRIQ